MSTRNAGTYWRMAWSQDWATRRPWSLSGVDMPYVGVRTEPKEIGGGVGMLTLGPIAIIWVTIP